MITIYLPQNINNFDKVFLQLGGKYVSRRGEIEDITIVIKDEFKKDFNEESVGVISNSRDLQNSVAPIWIVLKKNPVISLKSVVINNTVINCTDIYLVYYDSTAMLNCSDMLMNGGSSVYGDSVNFFITTVRKNKVNISSNIQRNTVIVYLHTILISLSLLLDKVSNKLQQFQIKILTKFEFKSFFLDQLILRMKQICTLYRSISNKTENLLVGRVAGIVITDVCIGVLVIYAIHQWTSPPELHRNFLIGAQIFAGNVLDILQWVRGVPAGLKLNQPLAEALASFFSYIVYLLLFYLELASSPLYILAYIFKYVGIFGISFQVALLADLLRLSVLHIYCLYIYAARIHMVQIGLLGSHWRGFLGKKWNPLKGRIDTRDEFSQRPSVKIFTVVIFTFVVFLLPTTTTFYAVLTSLRLALLSMNGLAGLLIWLLNYNPVYILWLSFIGSGSINGEICFELDPPKNPKGRIPLILKLRFLATPLNKILNAIHTAEIFSECPTPSFRYLFNSLIFAKDLL